MVNTEKSKWKSECHEGFRSRKTRREKEGEGGEVSASMNEAAGD
jgi:hypothetical protein